MQRNITELRETGTADDSPGCFRYWTHFLVIYNLVNLLTWSLLQVTPICSGQGNGKRKRCTVDLVSTWILLSYGIPFVDLTGHFLHWTSIRNSNQHGFTRNCSAHAGVEKESGIHGDKTTMCIVSHSPNRWWGTSICRKMSLCNFTSWNYQQAMGTFSTSHRMGVSVVCFRWSAVR